MSPCPWCGAAENEACSAKCAATPMHHYPPPVNEMPPREAERWGTTPTPAAAGCGCLIEALDGYFFTDQQFAAFFARTVNRHRGMTVVNADAFHRELAVRNVTPARRCPACGEIRPGRGNG